MKNKYENDIHETVEYAIVFDKYKPTQEEITEMAKELYDLKHNLWMKSK